MGSKRAAQSAFQGKRKRAHHSPTPPSPSSSVHYEVEDSSQSDDSQSTDSDYSAIQLFGASRIPARATAVATPSTLSTQVDLPIPSAQPTQSAVPKPASDSASFDPEQCRPSYLPIFRTSDIVVRELSGDRSEKELHDFTFTQWLDYFLTHPSFAGERGYLFSDEQYCTLLGYLTYDKPDARVIDYVVEKELDKTWEMWLYHETRDSTYQYLLMSYRGASVNDMQIAPVLVTFKEPATKKGGKVTRRRPTSSTPTTTGLYRRCVPHSQIEQVIELCHAGPLKKTKHLGQLATWDRLKADYDGISREIVRMYVKKCRTCQQEVRRQHRAALVPITAKRLFERIVIDLIDFTLKPSHGYRYIFHAVDHFSKYHWAWAIPNKEAATVAVHLATLLADVGPVQFIQSDQGGEFKGHEVQAVLAEFNCRPVNSSPYTPSTNGLVERGNGMLKAALNHWFIQEKTQDWYPPLARIRYQINCCKPRTTRYSPYELVFGKKPPSWDGLEQPWPLDADTLASAQMADEEQAAAAGAAAAASAAAAVTGTAAEAAAVTAAVVDTTSSAAALLATIAVDRSSQLPQHNSQLPVQVSQLRAAKSQQSAQPVHNSQLPARSLQLRAALTQEYPEHVLDLPVSEPGVLNNYVANELNVGGCHFVRLGGEGGGRCAISAFYNAVDPMDHIDSTGTQRLRAFDDVRKELRAMWETLNTDTTPADLAKRRRLRDMIFEIGNCGGSHDEQPEVPADVATNTMGDEQREAAWAQLGADLHISNKSLGTDAIGVMASERAVNVLLFINHTTVWDYGQGTARAEQHWKEATAEERQQQLTLYGRKTEGGRWVRRNVKNETLLVPQFIVTDRPWIVLYQRTHVQWTYRMDGGVESCSTSGGTGHYEAIVKPSISSDGAVSYSGVYSMGGDTAVEYDQVLLVGTRLQAEWNQQVASQSMCYYYDLKKKAHQFQLLDSVAVRVPGKYPRKGDTPYTLPGVVIGVHPYKVGNGKQVEHLLYTVWCEHGVLKDKLKVDRLRGLSLNSFPELVAFIATLTPQERLPVPDSKHQPPLTGSAQSLTRIGLKEAWAAHVAKRTQRVVSQKRNRTVVARTAANAADTSIAATLADHRRGPSLAIVTNQPAAKAAASSDSQASDIACILRETKQQYWVRYTQPEADPAVQYVSKAWLDKSAAHIRVVQAWRKQQQQKQEQQNVVDSMEDTADLSNCISTSDDE